MTWRPVFRRCPGLREKEREVHVPVLLGLAGCAMCLVTLFSATARNALSEATEDERHHGAMLSSAQIAESKSSPCLDEGCILVSIVKGSTWPAG